jgi:hypothetical protein
MLACTYRCVARRVEPEAGSGTNASNAAITLQRMLYPAL